MHYPKPLSKKYFSNSKPFINLLFTVFTACFTFNLLSRHICTHTFKLIKQSLFYVETFYDTQNVPIARCGGVSSLAAFIQLIVIQAWPSLPKHSYNNMTLKHYYFRNLVSLFAIRYLTRESNKKSLQSKYSLNLIL